MATTSPQRAYRAACPNCGAPVEFRSAASAFAVCGFCRSTVVREGQALRKVGQSAEVFEDHSPLQLGASGKAQGEAFTLVGRVQYRYAQGTWNEWHALFDNGRSGWLSEDNGSYVLVFDQLTTERAPAAASLAAGQAITFAGQSWWVGSVTAARLAALQGELPQAPAGEGEFTVVDLRNAGGEVGSLDYRDAQHPTWSVGKAVVLANLALQGLAEASEAALKGRSAECPNCGAALEVTLASTQSIVCHQCHAVVDVSQGVGGDLKHYVQENGMEPLIPLGSVGPFKFKGGAALPWQVVGYAERCEVDVEADGDGEADEQSFWCEYLLYNRTAGFAFLVDATDGWSWSAPITGAPKQKGDEMVYGDSGYHKLYSYRGRITYVLGEFYWHLERHQTTRNTDYACGKRRLNREQTGAGKDSEVVWSAGEILEAEAVRLAFKLPDKQRAAFRRDASPTVSTGGAGCGSLLMGGVVVVVLLMLLMRGCGGARDCSGARLSYDNALQSYQTCLAQTGNDFGAQSSCEPARQAYARAEQSHQACLREARSHTGGGSWGGYSSGGGHK